jgi:hypothetical protein
MEKTQTLQDRINPYESPMADISIRNNDNREGINPLKLIGISIGLSTAILWGSYIVCKYSPIVNIWGSEFK